MTKVAEKRMRRDKTIEVVTIKVDRFLKPPKGDGKFFFLALVLGIDDGYCPWLRINHEGEEVKVDDILECTVVLDRVFKNTPYHLMWQINRIHRRHEKVVHIDEHR